MSPEQQAVAAANEAFYDALTNRDLPAMERLWFPADWVECLHPGGVALRGWTTVRESWALLFNAQSSVMVAATGAPFGAHPLELPMLRHGGGAALFGLNVPACPEPDWLLVPGQPVIAGSVRFDVLFVPGHTPGHVAFYHAAAQVVFSGDVLFQQGIGRTDLPGGDYATLMDSIREVLLALPPETTVCPGHGPVTTIGAERRDNPFLAE